ncbi:hypothetical protein [Agromyces bauzanensis]
MVWYNEAAAEVQSEIFRLDWEPLLDTRPFEVTSRPKTIDTLRQKLQRDHATPLPSIQDIAGVRFEAEMSLDEQDAVVNAIAGRFGHDESAIKDLRVSPHSGYRAVHIWLRLDARVEVQVRTHLQGMWANMYESAADHFGRGIRYDELPNDPDERKIVERLRELSTADIAQLEQDRNESARLRMSAEERGLPEHPSPRAAAIMSRLRKLDAREASTEQRMQEMLTQLHDAFSAARRNGGS